MAVFNTEAPPAEIYISEYQESTGFFYHNVSVIFQLSVLIVNVSATVSWLAILRSDWLTVISRYFGGNPDEGSDFISNGFVASAISMLYTRKINPIFSDIQNRIFDFRIAALDMMNLERSYIFPRSRINLSFVVSFIFLGDIGETKLIREATLKGHISGSRRGVTILRYGLELPWSQLNLKSVKPL